VRTGSQGAGGGGVKVRTEVSVRYVTGSPTYLRYEVWEGMGLRPIPRYKVRRFAPYLRLSGRCAPLLCELWHVTSTEKVLRGAVRLSAAMVIPWRAGKPLVRQGGSLSI
jgi:hypothetical protein